MLSVKTNLLAMNADRQLGINSKKNSKIAERLSSGYKINRAADDAAGLAISEKMRRQIRGLHQSADNIEDGIGYVQTAEGALNEVHDILQRINQLAVKAANGTHTVEDRAAINSEIQQLKAEMNRIFSTTTFNERKIWDYGPGETLDYDEVDAVTFTDRSASITGGITNENCGVLALASSGYEVHADNSKIWVTWTGYDGNDYTTDWISWDDVEINGNIYSFKINEDTISDSRLLAQNGSALINKTVSFTIHEAATKNDIIKSIDGAKMASTPSVSMRVDTNDSVNISSNSNLPVYVSSVSLRYYAAYASYASGADGSYTFDGANDSFLVPSSMSGNLNAPVNVNDKYVFTFHMPGIGPVTATPSSGYYYSTDMDMDSKDYWWYWIGGYEDDGTWNPEKYKQSRHISINGTLGSVQNALQAPYGLLTDANGGNTDTGGRIYMTFDLNADTAFTYGDNISERRIGSFTIYIDVNQRKGTLNLTYDQMMDKITESLNSNTVLDFSNTNNDSASIGVLRGESSKIYIPIYPDDYEPYDPVQNLFIQAGTEAGQHISIEYEFLNVDKLGMTDTNTLTAESAGDAIDEVKEAIEIINEQRALFGAYQNRLEHAYNINKNTEENTQEAESVIRDTDVADMMMEYSINNILMQAGVSMLTQANQLPNTILDLLPNG